MTFETMTTSPAIVAMNDAHDSLNIAKAMLNYVICNRDRNDCEGESWVLGEIESRIQAAQGALDTAIDIAKDAVTAS